MSATTIWDQVLTLIEGKVGPHSFSTWFKPTSLKADQDRALVIRVPAPLYVEWLPRHYSVVLAEALAEVGRAQVQLVFEVETEVQPTPPAATSASFSAPTPPRDEVTAQVEFTPQPRQAPPPSAVIPGGLNPRYTFDTFIVGPSNQFAHAACRAVAEAPSRSYNPLFILWRSGPGQDPLDARHRSLRRSTQPVADVDLHLVRAVHERDDQRRAVRSHSRVPIAVPQRGRAPGRRHPVRLGQGRHSERVLPHLQRPARRAEADRHQQRSSAA